MNNALTLLNQKGLRATAARLQLLSTLKEAGQERLTAEQIFMQVAHEGSSLSLASVYRILKDLSDCGLVERGWYKEVHGVRLLFCLSRNGEGSRESEIVCKRCNRTMAFSMPGMREALNRVAQARRLQPEERPIVIQITCPGCAALPGS